MGQQTQTDDAIAAGHGFGRCGGPGQHAYAGAASGDAHLFLAVGHGNAHLSHGDAEAAAVHGVAIGAGVGGQVQPRNGGWAKHDEGVATEIDCQPHRLASDLRLNHRRGAGQHQRRQRRRRNRLPGGQRRGRQRKQQAKPCETHC